jgi:hypothetical protein
MSGTSGFSHKYNTDDVLIRAIIVGLINSLNEQIYITNTVSDTVTQTVPVPFFYAFSGDERFLQDYFSDWSDCAPQWIEGNYDPIPRGSVQLSGINVAAGNMTSRYVRAFHVREEKGELKRYNSYLNSIPLNMTFKVDVMVDTTIDSFKVVQQIIKTFYKTLVFRVNFDGTVVPSQAGFTEAYTLNKLFEYTYGENSRITITFDIEVESYFPIFDPEQEMFAGTRINYFAERTTPDLAQTKAQADVTPPSPVVIYPSNVNVNDGASKISSDSANNSGIDETIKTIDPTDSKYKDGYWE